MSRKYTVTKLDTFENISLIVYGDKKYGDLLEGANPTAKLVRNPDNFRNWLVAVGTVLQVPDLVPETPRLTVTKGSDDITLRIGKREITEWESLKIDHSLTSMSTIQAVIPFEDPTKETRGLLRPFTYEPVDTFIGNELQFNGTLVSVEPRVLPGVMRVVIGAYAKPGVLSDCTTAGREFSRMKLEDIIRSICGPYSIPLVSAEDTGKAFDQKNISVDRRIMEFFVQLAQLKNMVINNTESGALRLYRPIADGKPVATINADSAPLVRVTPRFNARAYYSSISGTAPTIPGFPGGNKTPLQNPFLRGTFRPIYFTVKAENEAETASMVSSKISRMFANACDYEVEMAGWEDPSGALWKVNTMISLEYPRAMIYKPYKFLVSRVSFQVSANEKVTVLTLVVPGSYSGNIPARLPWVE